MSGRGPPPRGRHDTAADPGKSTAIQGAAPESARQAPLTGVVLCCTGIDFPKRKMIYQLVRQCVTACPDV